jgi:metal-responsive CopG/Arc/MetJ family transcriptional regulator
MPTVKTAISIDRDLFEEIERISSEIHVPRSRLFSQAVENFVKQKENILLLKKLNDVYAKHPTPEDLSFVRAAKKARHKIFGNLWK